MVAQLKRSYLRLVRKAYRYLRHPRLRRVRWLQALLKPVFDRELWHPCRETVAGGVSIGLFCSQLPIPFQMLVASLTCVKARVNIPYACLACWVTNPLTYPIIILYQMKTGAFLRDLFDLPLHPLFSRIPIGQGNLEKLADFVLGFLSFGALLSLLAYPVVYLISAAIPKLIPKQRYQRVKARIMARKKDSQTTPN
ncbi:MAG: DUF2062 domain-containing protein [Verrucomicrobiales bacterium]